MVHCRHIVILFGLVLFIVNTIAEPFTLGVTIASSLAIGAFYGGYNYAKCQLYECCNDRWIVRNFTGLRSALNSRLYGQHLALQTVVSALRAHFDNQEPKKALVMSFHGWTGTGKNHLAALIAEHIYAIGVNSAYFHLFVSTMHFPHRDDVDTYQRNLRAWIIGNVTICDRSLFIFDELHEMDKGVIDAIKPFIDYHPHVQGVDFRKSVFLFLSNSAGSDINQKALQHHESGRRREEISLAEMETVIMHAAFNENGKILQFRTLFIAGGLHESQLIRAHLIDHFIPFLPLAREHVMLCARDYLRRRGYDIQQDLLNKVVDSIEYRPSTNPIYSSSGCKRVAQKVELALQEEFDRDNQHNNNFYDEL